RIAAGDRRTVTVPLNRTGTKLLSSTHTLRTTLIALSLHRTLERTSVTFTAASTRPKSSTHGSSKPKRSRPTHAPAHTHRAATSGSKHTKHSSGGSHRSAHR